jgi:hypothetical protein
LVVESWCLIFRFIKSVGLIFIKRAKVGILSKSIGSFDFGRFAFTEISIP